MVHGPPADQTFQGLRHLVTSVPPVGASRYRLFSSLVANHAATELQSDRPILHVALGEHLLGLTAIEFKDGPALHLRIEHF